MNIFLCGSLEFSFEILDIAKILRKKGHLVKIPPTADMIVRGDVTLQQICEEKNSGNIAARTIRQDSIRTVFNIIKQSDAVVVLNYDKNGVYNYIGGNVLIEMGFTHVLKKRLFLLNPIPNVSFKDEIQAMKPLVLKGDFSKLDE